MKANALSKQQLLFYALLAMPLAFAGLPIYMHLPNFYAAEYGISLGTLGFILLIIRGLDAIQDPLIGILSDKFQHQRKSIILAAALMLAVSFFCLFHAPSNILIPWLCVFLFLSSLSFSVASINYNAYGSLWSSDDIQKTRITGWRESLTLIGLCAAILLPQALNNFTIYAGLMVFVMGITALFFMRWDAPKIHSFQTIPLKRFFRMPKEQLTFYSIFILSTIASAIPAALVLFFINDRLNEEDHTALFLGLYMLGGILGMPLWIKLVNLFKAEKIWLGSILLACIAFIGALTLQQGEVVAFAAICFFSGLAFGAELILPPVILSKIIDHTGRQDETGAAFSLYSLSFKLALAIGSGGALLALHQAGFVPNASNSASALNILSLIYAAIPCLIKAVAALLLYFLFIHRKGKQHEKTNIISSHRGTHRA